MTKNEFQEYGLEKEDEIIVNALKEHDNNIIDSWIKQCVSNKFQKVAMIVARAIDISDKEGKYLDVPDVYFGIRIEKLVEEGYLEARGNLKNMRFSEVRTLDN